MQLNRATDTLPPNEISQSARIGNWKIHVQDQLVHWSDAVFEMHEESIRKTLTIAEMLSFYHEDFIMTAKKGIDEAIQKKRSWDFEAIVVTANNHEVWIRSTGFPICEQDKVIEIIGTYTEIDGIKRKLRQLSDRATMFDQMFNNAQLLICLHDPSGKINKVSIAAQTILGYNECELIGKEFISIVYSKDLKWLRNESDRQWSEIDSISNTLEHRFRHKNGRFLWFLTTTSTLRNRCGDPTHLLTTSVEITKRRELEENIKALNSQLSDELNRNSKNLQNATIQLNQQVSALDRSALVSIIDGEFRFIYVNKLFSEVTGFEFNQIKDKPVDYIMSSNSSKPGFLERWEVLGKGKTWSGETRYRKVNNEEIWLKSTISPLKDASGRIIKYVCIDFDITQSKRMSEELKIQANELIEIQADLAESLEKEKELSKLKSSFVATASHQFRTPLTVIQSSMSILQMQMSQMKLESTVVNKVNAVYERVQTQVRKMTEMMNEVLILGKIENSGIQAKPRSLDVQSFISDLVYKLNLIEENRVIKLVTMGSPRELQLDVHLFEHALINVLTNALKYSQGKPDPIVELDYLISEGVEIRVKDFGIGIPKNEIAKVFDSFYRATNVDEISGTGLGMAIVKQYVILNQGSVSIDSELGKGTTITINF